MANRQLNQFAYSFDKKPVTVTVVFDGGGAGANVSLLDYQKSVTKTGANTAVVAGTAGWKGVKSITRVGDGDYTIKFQDNYYRIIGIDGGVYSKDNSTAPLANAYYVKKVDIDTAGGATVEIVTYLATIGTPVAPGTNDRWFFSFSFADSSAP